MRYLLYMFAGIGGMAVILFVVGLVLDFRAFDRTQGGYDPPYTGFTGPPVDWDSLDITTTGVVKRGYVVNVHVDGTTGMISFELFRQRIDFRPLSGRALVVHKPREALRRLGFAPEF